MAFPGMIQPVKGFKSIAVNRNVNVFVFLKNDRFIMKMTIKNRKRNDRFKNNSFLKMVVFKTIVSLTIVNDDPSITMANDDHSLTIVNEERKPT